MKEQSVTYYTSSDEETIKLGRRLGVALKEGDAVALVGELGSGKTCFTKGVGLGLGVPADVIITSPSFSLVNEYEGRYPFFHMDGYRLESLSDFFEFDEKISDLDFEQKSAVRLGSASYPSDANVTNGLLEIAEKRLQ